MLAWRPSENTAAVTGACVDGYQAAGYAEPMIDSSRGGTMSSCPRPRWVRRLWVLALFAGALGGVSACSHQAANWFDVIDYRAGGGDTHYRETFTEGFFDLDASGNLDLILSRAKIDPDDPAGHITQVIHIRTFWRSIPGVTVAERTQINAEVAYYIISGEVGQSFEGAGSVFFSVNRSGDTITGSLDLARLKPTRQLIAADDLFERVDLSGTFVATKNRRRVRDEIHDMARRFGPRPR